MTCKMVVCRYYQQGYCRYGNKCKFEHTVGGQSDYGRNYYSSYSQHHEKQAFLPSQNFTSNNRFGVQADNYRNDNRNPKSANLASSGRQETFDDFVITVLKEVEDFEKQKLWPFSAFGVAKSGSNLCNYPGLKDVSPEELRWEAYQNLQQGTMSNFIHGIVKLSGEQKSIHQEIKSRSAPALDILNKVFHNQPLPAYLSGQNGTFGEVAGSTSPSNFTFSLAHLNQSSSHTPLATAKTRENFIVSTSDTLKLDNSWSALGPPPPQSIFDQSVMTNTTPVFGGRLVNKVFTNITSEPTHSANTNIPFKEATPVLHNNVSVFSASTAVVDKSLSEIYTALDRLTTEERQQYEAPSFSLGKVPVRPPPKELCV